MKKTRRNEILAQVGKKLRQAGEESSEVSALEKEIVELQSKLRLLKRSMQLSVTEASELLGSISPSS